MSDIGVNLPTKDTTYISPLKFWVQKVLPLTYDDSLSYYELLSKVVYKLNEVIEIVNPLGAGIGDTIEKYMEGYEEKWAYQLQEFRTEIMSTVNQNNSAIQKQLLEFQTQVNLQINENQTANVKLISELEKRVLAQVAEIAANVSTTDEANKAWTLAQIEELKSTITDNLPPVIDPSDGLEENIQTVLNHMWDAFRPNALTAAKYDALELTATEYDSKELTAENYDKYGEILLVPSQSYVYVGNVPVEKSAINMEVLKNGIH